MPAALALAGCGGFTETLQRGYVIQEGALEQIPIGATQEQVLIVLGTPSTVATVSGEAFYYISQTLAALGRLHAHEVKDQRVVAVYFDKNRRVERLANYGLKDGKVFDFVSQTTPTGGKEFAYLQRRAALLQPEDLIADREKGPACGGPLAFLFRAFAASAPASPAATARRCW